VVWAALSEKHRPRNAFDRRGIRFEGGDFPGSPSRSLSPPGRTRSSCPREPFPSIDTTSCKHAVKACVPSRSAGVVRAP